MEETTTFSSIREDVVASRQRILSIGVAREIAKFAGLA
jgi:hypothetical protein